MMLNESDLALLGTQLVQQRAEFDPLALGDRTFQSGHSLLVCVRLVDDSYRKHGQ